MKHLDLKYVTTWEGAKLLRDSADLRMKELEKLEYDSYVKTVLAIPEVQTLLTLKLPNGEPLWVVETFPDQDRSEVTLKTKGAPLRLDFIRELEGPACQADYAYAKHFPINAEELNYKEDWSSEFEWTVTLAYESRTVQAVLQHVLKESFLKNVCMVAEQSLIALKANLWEE